MPKIDGKLVVAIKGVDVYDPTTGQIRFNSTDDLACWFIDTNYNNYFTRNVPNCAFPFIPLPINLHSKLAEAWIFRMRVLRRIAM